MSNTVQALCCDTPNPNLGAKKGAAVILERLLQRDLLYLPCRHHIFEIVLGGVYDELMGASKSPITLLFKKFQTEWPEIVQDNYKTGMEDERIRTVLETRIDDIASFINSILNSEKQPRDDYREFLLLCLIFTGKAAPSQIKFYKPGAQSRARWMAKAIYGLKIFMFREQFQLNTTETKALREFCIFVVFLYVEPWFTATRGYAAANLDLNFIKRLHCFKEVNKPVSEIGLKKFCNHLWYLSPEAAAMAFFDESIPDVIKLRMVQNIKQAPEDEEESSVKRIRVIKQNYHFLLDKEVDYFINPQSLNFFKRFKLDSSFLDVHVSEWKSNAQFISAREIVRRIRVVNDVAERGIKLITEYNDRLTHDDEQKQYILQLISAYNKQYSGTTKKTLMKCMQ